MMKTHKKLLKEKLQSNDFREKYNEEKKLINLSLALHNEREKRGLSQSEVAKIAQITQQQVSKVENGDNCNILTFMKVCRALDLQVSFVTVCNRQFA